MKTLLSSVLECAEKHRYVLLREFTSTDEEYDQPSICLFFRRPHLAGDSGMPIAGR